MALRINLIAWNNGVGLSRDLALLRHALEAGGFRVHVTAIGRGKLRKWLRPPLVRVRPWVRVALRLPPAHDVNIMLEHIRPEDFASAKRTFFIPNPEWCNDRDVALLPRVHGVLAKTRHAVAIFEALGARTALIGFTSEDRLDAAVTRERTFFHLAGRSSNKGTDALLKLWQRHPEWPRLTVVQSPRTASALPPTPNIDHRIDYIDDTELRRLQNANVFHLCCSETEGFGHYLVEAMSVGAVVLTTDAPPMNELVDASRGVPIRISRTGTQCLAQTCFVDAEALEHQINALLTCDDAHLGTLGQAARRWFESNDAAFPERLRAGFEALLQS